MVTRIEISGFKSFTDFAVDLAPLTVIAGANASGKSNLLDALRVLKGLAEGRSLGQSIFGRGSGVDLFTKFGEEDTASRLKIAVELLLPKTVLFQRTIQRLTATRMRYEVTISRPSSTEGDYFEIHAERLRFLRKEEDRYFENLRKRAVATDYFFYAPDETKPLINYQVEEYREHAGTRFNVNDHPDLLEETLLSGQDRDVHAVAVREFFLRLNPVNLLSRSNFSNQGLEEKPRNGNSGTVISLLSALKKQRPEEIRYLSKRVRQIIKHLKKIDVHTDEFGRVDVTATDENGARFLADSLSEGTLRVLALATYLTLDIPDSTLLLEEPENGVDPRVLGKMLELLLDLSSDFSETNNELRQVIFTTHSAHLLELILQHKALDRIQALLTAKLTLTGGKYGQLGGISSTRMFKIYSEEELADVADPVARVTYKQAMEYLRGSLPYKELMNA